MTEQDGDGPAVTEPIVTEPEVVEGPRRRARRERAERRAAQERAIAIEEARRVPNAGPAANPRTRLKLQHVEPSEA